MLISQAINRDYYLMSEDSKFKNYDLKLIWKMIKLSQKITKKSAFYYFL
jgi:hypothetical protein